MAVRVVAAVIERDGRVLVAQRSPGRPFPLQWEFPGGKVEPGEEPEQALMRELDEELGIRVEVGDLLDRVRHDYGGGQEYELLFFACRLLDGEPRVRAGQGLQDAQWVELAHLGRRDFLEGDRGLVRRLVGSAVRHPGSV